MKILAFGEKYFPWKWSTSYTPSLLFPSALPLSLSSPLSQEPLLSPYKQTTTMHFSLKMWKKKERKKKTRLKNILHASPAASLTSIFPAPRELVWTSLWYFYFRRSFVVLNDKMTETIVDRRRVPEMVDLVEEWHREELRWTER